MLKTHTVQQRNSSFEILRIVCILMVIIQHTCESAMLGGFDIASSAGTLANYIILRFLYSCSRIAVNVFILISGYFSVKNDIRKIGKALTLLFMTLFYSCCTYLVKIIIGIHAFSVTDLLYNAFPKNYYVYLFVTLYIISPYINKLVRSLTKKQYCRIIVICMLLFSVWSTFINLFSSATGWSLVGVYTVTDTGTGRGFSIVNFILLYMISGYFMLFPPVFRKHSKLIMFGGYLFLSLITASIAIWLPVMSSALLNYDSVFVIIQSVLMFMIFMQFRIKSNKVINIVAKCVFGVFLIHYSVIKELAKLLKMERMFSGNVFQMLLCLCGLVIGGFLISSVVDLTIRSVSKPVGRIWKKTKLYNLCLSNVNEE